MAPKRGGASTAAPVTECGGRPKRSTQRSWSYMPAGGPTAHSLVQGLRVRRPPARQHRSVRG
eukprot:scaffold26179_cov133-Isochrysis_galbana.AAC.2